MRRLKIIITGYMIISHKLKVFNYMSKNLTSIFINKSKLDRNMHTYKCLAINCVTCKFVNTNSYIMLKNGFIQPIMSNANCESDNLVYIISAHYATITM